MTPTPAAARFADHTLNTRFEHLTRSETEAAKVFILDSFGVGIAGSSVDGAERLLAIAQGWGSSAGVQVWGRAQKLSPSSAAFLNAWQMHNQEFDCLHEAAVVHALASVLPAAMAAAEHRGGVSGGELIAAVAAGADIAACLGIASHAELRFFRPATAGGFGAVAAAGRLIGLDRQGLEAAFAWQLAQASGTMQAHIEGSPILAVQVGLNARAAMQSCELATVGFEPARQVFEGPYGYLSLFEGTHDLDPVLQSLGRVRRIAEFSHKPFPAGRATHGGIEGVMALREAHRFVGDDVAEVVVRAPPLILRLVGRPWQPERGASYARLCMGYAVAKVLQHGELRPTDFRGDALTDPKTQTLADRVRVEADDNPDPNALAPQSVTVRLGSGDTLRWECETMLAHPRRPLSREQHLAKFRACFELAAERQDSGRADRLIEMVDKLEELPDVREISGQLSGGVWHP